jgi:hypothetical protein
MQELTLIGSMPQAESSSGGSSPIRFDALWDPGSGSGDSTAPVSQGIRICWTFQSPVGRISVTADSPTKSEIALAHAFWNRLACIHYVSQVPDDRIADLREEIQALVWGWRPALPPPSSVKRRAIPFEATPRSIRPHPKLEE